MAKKNPYITTIGFNKEDPDHVYVADFLNSMGRGKGQYIVKAIMAYQNPKNATACSGTNSWLWENKNFCIADVEGEGIADLCIEAQSFFYV